MHWCRAVMLLVVLSRMIVSPANGAATLTVVPGKSIGSLRLGMARHAAWKHYGRPTDSRAFQRNGRAYQVDEWGPDTGPPRLTVLSEHGKVSQIEVCEVPYRTPHGLTDTSIFAAIRRKHPGMAVSLLRLHEENGACVYADDVRRGIAWQHYAMHPDMETASLLQGLRTDRLIVHRPGRRILPDTAGGWQRNSPLLVGLRAWFKRNEK